MDELDILETEVVLYYHQSFDVTSAMSLTRLRSLLELAHKRENRHRTIAPQTDKEKEAASTEFLMKALKAQKEFDALHSRPNVRVTG